MNGRVEKKLKVLVDFFLLSVRFLSFLETQLVERVFWQGALYIQ